MAEQRGVSKENQNQSRLVILQEKPKPDEITQMEISEFNAVRISHSHLSRMLREKRKDLERRLAAGAKVEPGLHYIARDTKTVLNIR